MLNILISANIVNVQYVRAVVRSFFVHSSAVERSLCELLLCELLLPQGGELLAHMIAKKDPLKQFTVLLNCIFLLAPVVDHSYITIVSTLSGWIMNG